MSRKVILITGGAGFIGKNLINFLDKRDDIGRIIVLDNYITSKPIRSTSDKVIEHGYYNICHHNVIDFIKQTYTHIDEIYHLASLASPVAYKNFPVHTLDVGYIGTKNMLELCVYYSNRSFRPCKFLFSSTSEVYGDALEHPQREGYYGNVNPYGERSNYDESKRVAEALIYSYRKLYKIDTRIVRIFNTYGPHMNINDGRIVTEIMKGLLFGSTLSIFGDGKQTRSLCYVDDMVNMIHRVMEEEYTEPINLGNDIEYSVNELVEISKQVYHDTFSKDHQMNIIYTPIDKDDPKVRRPCLETNRKILGETLYTSLNDGLKNTMLHFYELGYTN